MRDMEITNTIRKVLEIKEAIKVVIIKEVKEEMIIEAKDDYIYGLIFHNFQLIIYFNLVKKFLIESYNFN